MSPTVFAKYTNQKKVKWQQYRLCLAIAEYQILGGKHFLTLKPESEEISWLKKVQKVQYLQKEVPLPVDPPAGHATQVGLSSFLVTYYNRLSLD